MLPFTEFATLPPAVVVFFLLGAETLVLEDGGQQLQGIQALWLSVGKEATNTPMMQSLYK